MQPFRSKSDEVKLSSPLAIKVEADVLVSLATIPLLGALSCGRAINRWIIELGLASEEIFRGERLPVLQTPDKSATPSP